MKNFFDRCHYTAPDRVNGRPNALLICAGSDGQNTIRKVARIAAAGGGAPSLRR